MQGQSNLNCKQMEEALEAYYDLELSAEEAQAVELHLVDCAACTARLNDIDSLVSQLKSLPPIEWNGDLSDAIAARIFAEESTGAAPTEIKSANDQSPVAGAGNVVPISQARNFSMRYLFAAAACMAAIYLVVNQFTPARQLAQVPTGGANLTAHDSAQNSVRNAVASDEKIAALPSSTLNSSSSPAINEQVVQSKNSGNKLANVSTSSTNSSTSSSLANSSGNSANASRLLKPEVVDGSKKITATEAMLAETGESRSPVVEHDRNGNNVNDAEEIVAVYDYDTADSGSDFGISTNEDGLYAIKL